MDLDSIISILFLLAFFIIPTLFKMFLAKKKNQIGSQGQPSFLGKIGEQIQKFIKDLEEQARQPEAQYEQQEENWETFSEENENFAYEESAMPPELKESLKESLSLKESTANKQVDQKDINPLSVKKTALRRSGDYCLRTNALQNAVVWSEILSKPLALRDE